MELHVIPSARLDFARSAEQRREHERDRDRRFVEIDQRKRKDEKDADRRAENASEDFALIVLASEVHIAEVTVKLDLYDTAAVNALMTNERDLDRVRLDLKEMFDKAYVLPDGRRVFKTEDGMKVFDEQGDELQDLDPAEIEDWRPRWEQVVSGRDAEQELLEERQQIHDYQETLDASRERLSEEGLTEHELKDLEKSLEAKMPDRVRQQLADDGPAPAPDKDAAPSQSAFRPGVNLGMPAL